MLKLLAVAFAAITAAGCALFDAHQQTAAAAVAPEATFRDSSPLRPISLRAEPALKSSQPIGLAPCATGVFRAGSCWRKGDRHIVFYDPVPEGLDVSPLTAPNDDQ